MAVLVRQRAGLQWTRLVGLEIVGGVISRFRWTDGRTVRMNCLGH